MHLPRLDTRNSIKCNNCFNSLYLDLTFSKMCALVYRNNEIVRMEMFHLRNTLLFMRFQVSNPYRIISTKSACPKCRLMSESSMALTRKNQSVMSLDNKYYSYEMKLMEKVRNAQRICNHPACDKPAINSHILQENGILNRIADDKKTFMEYTPWSKFRPEELYPASINTNKMFTFQGFCNHHDSAVFKEIENGSLIFSFYKHNLLFSYRGLLHDLYRALISRDFA